MDTPTRFAWDDGKAASNLRKHGLSFQEAVSVFIDPDRVVITSAREQDGEIRQKAIGRMSGRLFTVVFVMRGGACRIISARRANKAEERAYGHG